MHRIDTNENPNDNEFHDGDSSTEPAVLGTYVDADWLNAVQGEISIFIELMGITLVKGKNTQLKEAVKLAINPVITKCNEIIAYLDPPMNEPIPIPERLPLIGEQPNENS